MARPQISPDARKLNVTVAPPAELTARQLQLWHREFSRFPPGYFTPSDVRGMLLYLDAVTYYDNAVRQATMAEAGGYGSKEAVACRRERALALSQLHKIQRDLRMYPATRTHREIHGSLANNPNTQTAQPGQTEGWRGLFAVPDKADAPTPRKPKGGRKNV